MSDHSTMQTAKYMQMQNMQNATSSDLKPQLSRLEQISQRELDINKSLDGAGERLYKLCTKLGISPPNDQEEQGSPITPPEPIGLLGAIFMQQTGNLTQLRRLHSLLQELSSSL